MSHASQSSGRSALSLRAIVCFAIPVVLAIGFVSSPFAQSAPGGYGPGGPGTVRGSDGWGGDDRGRPPGSEHRMLSREAIEGPPSPALMRDSIGLSQDQLQRYSERYGNHMAATRSLRDSVRTTMKAMRSAFESGDRSTAREQRDVIERESKELSKRDTDFDKGLKDILTKDQQKRYQKWKENRKKTERDQWTRERRRAADPRA